MGRRYSLWGIGWTVRHASRVLRYATLACVTGRAFAAGLDTGHPLAVQRAEFVLRQLQTLSDTGIYSTLSLKNIFAAATRDGVFHHNTLLTLDLASPYYSSGLREERFEIMVMEHKGDGHISFSIDSFPQMDTEAMEGFYIQKVEQHRQSRAVFFSSIDGEAEGDARAVASVGTSDPARLAVDAMTRDTHDLQALLHEGGCYEEDPLRKAAHFEVNRRLEQGTT